MKWAEWIEPFGPNNEPVYLAVPKTTAVAFMRDLAKRRGNNYPSDEEAFMDFVVVHWADIKERQ